MANIGSYHGPSGSGYFSKNNVLVAKSFKQINPFIAEVLEKIHFNGDVFVICDYGTADGGTSLSMITTCVEYIKAKYGKGQQIHVIYEDQATNDFKWTFMRLTGLTEEKSSYLLEHENIFVSSIGRSFFYPLLPKESVHLSFSATAYHYISKRPCPLKTSVLHLLSTTEEERQCYKQQAKEDWNTILTLRCRELAKGGHMAVALMGFSPEGNYSGGRTFLPTVNGILQEMLKNGDINKDELVAINFCMYMRNEVEIREPFEDSNSEISKSGLQLTSIQWVISEDDLQKGVESNEAYADIATCSFKSWGYNIILNGIRTDIPQTQRVEKADLFFSKFENLGIKSPTAIATEYVNALIHIQKV